MEQVVYFVVAVAIAAALLALTLPSMSLLPNPLDSAYALVYVVPKPLNSNVWIGVKPAYSDVVVRAVAINGTVYAVNASVPYDMAARLAHEIPQRYIPSPRRIVRRSCGAGVN